MEMRPLGRTGLNVSRVGVGLSEIGSELTLKDEAVAGRILNEALDAGINFLDTAACYGISEELIGRTVAHRRQDFVLATKCGHAAGGYPGRDWTAQTVRDSIDRSLVRMKTDCLDLVQLHSCGVETLEQGEVINELVAARQAGKTRFIGYSGDNEAARWAVNSGLFDTLQTSFNLVDQQARTWLLPQAAARGIGLIAKRPIANGAWGASRSPSSYAANYYQRAQIMAQAGPIPDAPEDRIWLALGFTLAHPEVDTAIVGTRNPEHMRANIRSLTTEPALSPAAVEALHHYFDQFGSTWVQLR